MTLGRKFTVAAGIGIGVAGMAAYALKKAGDDIDVAMSKIDFNAAFNPFAGSVPDSQMDVVRARMAQSVQPDKSIISGPVHL